ERRRQVGRLRRHRRRGGLLPRLCSERGYRRGGSGDHRDGGRFVGGGAGGGLFPDQAAASGAGLTDGDLIRFEDLKKSFGPKVVFDGLTLTVRPHETLSVIGGSGSGKSVLLKSL